MAVTPTSSTYTWGMELTAKLREFVKTSPVEQSQLGNRWLDAIQVRHDMSINDAGYLQIPLSFVEDAKGDFYADWDTVSSTDSDDVTMAEEQMVSFSEPILLSRAEKRRNQGKALFKLLAHKTKQAMLRTKNKWANALINDTTGGPITIGEIFPEDGGDSTTALHGVRGDQNTGWQGQFKDMSDSLSSNLEDLDELIENCRKYGLREPSYLLTSQAVYLAFMKSARTDLRINVGPGSASGRIADQGFNGVSYQGLPVIADRHFSFSGGDESLYVVADDAISFCEDPMDNWTLEGPFDMSVNNQHGWKWFIHKTGQLVCTERGAGGVLFDITAS